MNRQNLSDLAVFAAIAEERSFTRAAARLEVSGSALSHNLRALEERLGVKLIQRTTRSIALTEAGERLLERLKPALEDIEAAVEELQAGRDRPGGRVRISAHRTAAMLVIAPQLRRMQIDYPDVVVELAIEDGLVDIVSKGFDAGVRSGELVAKDMISVRIGPGQRSAVVAAPAYFRGHAVPSSPEDLRRHDCIAFRLATSGVLYRWEFEKDGRMLNVAVEPGFITNDVDLLVRAALDGVGVAYVLESQVAEHLASGALVRVLGDWCVPFAGDFLYYPSRRQMTPALRALVNTLRHVRV